MSVAVRKDDPVAVTRPRPVRGDGADPLVRAKRLIDVVTEPDAAARLAPEWAELVAAAAASPFVGPDYGLTWWRHCGRGRLHVVTVRVSGRLVALAPWHRRSIAGLTVLRWLGHGVGTVGEVLVRPGFAAAAAALWDHVAAVPRVVLELVDYRDDGGGLAQLRRAEALRATVALRDVCPVVDLDGVGSAADLLARLHRRHRLRRTLQRADQELRAAGSDFTVVTARDPDGLAALLPDVERIQDAAEARAPRPTLLRPPWRAFTLDLLGVLTATGSATLHVARVDRWPAAFELTLDDATTVASLACRYHPRFARFSPGHLLTRAILDHAVATGLTRYDLMIGDGPHKLPWATGSYDTLTVHAAPRGLLPRRAALELASRARAELGGRRG